MRFSYDGIVETDRLAAVRVRRVRVPESFINNDGLKIRATRGGDLNNFPTKTIRFRAGLHNGN